MDNKATTSKEPKPQQTKLPVKKPPEEDKKKGKKRIADDKSEIETPLVNVGDKLKVYYGPTHESKVTYEAKVIEIDKDSAEPSYLVHYTGWNTRYNGILK